MQYWLMKSEPNAYSIKDLERDKITAWDGVRNYQVRNMLRDDMRVGDKALFYHSNAGEATGVAGEMKVVKAAQVDDTQFDQNDEHFDAKAKKDNPRWWCPTMGFVSVLPKLVTLNELKQSKALQDSRLVQKGNRLSVVPLTKAHYDAIITLAKT